MASYYNPVEHAEQRRWLTSPEARESTVAPILRRARALPPLDLAAVMPTPPPGRSDSKGGDENINRLSPTSTEEAGGDGRELRDTNSSTRSNGASMSPVRMCAGSVSWRAYVPKSSSPTPKSILLPSATLMIPEDLDESPAETPTPTARKRNPVLPLDSSRSVSKEASSQITRRRATVELPANRAASKETAISSRSASKETAAPGRRPTRRLTVSSFSKWNQEKQLDLQKLEGEEMEQTKSEENKSTIGLARVARTLISGRRGSEGGGGGGCAGLNALVHKARLKAAVEVKVEPLSTAQVVAYAAEAGLRPHEVKDEWEVFGSFPQTSPGVITKESFDTLLRRKCHLSKDSVIPRHLWPQRTNVNTIGVIAFGEYLLWWNSVKFSEAVLVSDYKEKLLRQAAREAGLSLREVEDIAQVFDRFDADNSGHIDQEEFVEVLKVVLNSNATELTPPMVKFYWRQIDEDGDGDITLREFLLWYSKQVYSEDSVAGG
eukprot:TRINITY_DN6037_c0_g1_i1.p1 TRINITY_DN6037_c0_g1~~TRINITY_DN6037_c0_g1_i1.p1  ORF type:complete len:492 (-),score=71.96 TRINITY_DN6037_c0_g1_i1:275-1750(-)